MGGPLKLKFANHFIIYQKRPFRGRFGTGRLHSELWDWGVNLFLGRMYSKFIQKYGRVELRAKQPKGYGLWPALWMMPHPYELNGLADIVWPQAGEIDIFEGRGQHPGQD